MQIILISFSKLQSQLQAQLFHIVFWRSQFREKLNDFEIPSNAVHYTSTVLNLSNIGKFFFTPLRYCTMGAICFGHRKLVTEVVMLKQEKLMKLINKVKNFFKIILHSAILLRSADYNFLLRQYTVFCISVFCFPKTVTIIKNWGWQVKSVGIAEHFFQRRMATLDNYQNLSFVMSVCFA